MTDRIAYLTVALDDDYRTDDIEAVVEAIKMIKSVQSVTLGKPLYPMDHINRERVKAELRDKLWAVLK